MKTALFVPVSTSGHIYASFKVAKYMQNKGYRVIYACEAEAVKIIQSQGFDYELCPIFLFVNRDNIEIGEQNTSIEKVFEHIVDRISNTNLKIAQERLIRFEKVVAKVNPEVMFLDSFIGANYILMRHKPKTILVGTMISTHHDKFVPPLNSRLIPTKSLFSQLQVSIAWQKYYLKRRWNHILRMGDSIKGLTKRIAKKRNLSIKESIYYSPTFHLGLKNVPELVLPPIAVDFPRYRKLPHQYYVGVCVDLEREEKDYDNAYNDFTKEINIRYIS
jgi:hypothetical protein